MREAVIASACRTPVGKAYKGALRAARPDDLAALAIGEALKRVPGLDPKEVEDVILGFKRSRRFAILLVEQGLHFAARLAEKYVVMAKGAVVAAGKSDELSAEMVRQHLTV